eukprot:TRINITY_DN2063_c0_g3_i4.p1 TRINITY_DN2063_c0_g3~~TRINITY_DN2063_c0_g3_i4.p1  ORF type:complete len:223 (-),score=59.91 TRINITY_DN2063_c0_g3_i4:655-1323(-)
MTLENIDSFPVLDKETAINQFDDAELFEQILMGFEEMSMRGNLNDLKKGIENNDYVTIRLSAHSLKGASSYIHADRVRELTSMIQQAVDSKKYEDVHKCYPALIKQCILLKRRIRFEEYAKNGKVFDSEGEEDFDVPIAKNYKVMKRSTNDFDVVQVSGSIPEVKIAQRDTNDQISPKSKPKNPSKERSPERTNSSSLKDRKPVEIEMEETARPACCACAIF